MSRDLHNATCSVSLAEVIAFGNKDEVLKVNAYLDSMGQTTKNQVRNLGVILETDLSFSSSHKCAKTLATFKSSLKTHLFSCAFVE